MWRIISSPVCTCDLPLVKQPAGTILWPLMTDWELMSKLVSGQVFLQSLLDSVVLLIVVQTLILIASTCSNCNKASKWPLSCFWFVFFIFSQYRSAKTAAWHLALKIPTPFKHVCLHQVWHFPLLQHRQHLGEEAVKAHTDPEEYYRAQLHSQYGSTCVNMVKRSDCGAARLCVPAEPVVTITWQRQLDFSFH